jgi:hypothetical protein
MRRQIIYSHQFEADVREYGGYLEIDKALDTILEALANDPYKFHKFESDFTSFRWANTRRIGQLPPLSIMFSIDANGNVTLEKIFETYDP